MPLDSDTKSYLEEVKKGKPRRFAMVTKGEKIVSLILYKKGSLERYKKEAKEEGKGQFYHGVIDGKGQNISFKLCRADGFDEPPGSEVKLRQFLKDEAGMQFKPAYEIVDSLPKLTDADEESTTGPAAIAPTEPAPIASPPIASPPTTPPDAALAAKLTDALSKMTPLIKQAVAAIPARKEVILQSAAKIKSAIAAGELSAAQTALVNYGKRLKEIAASAVATAGGARQPSDGSQVALTAARLKWDKTRKDVLAELEALEVSIVEAFASIRNFPPDQLDRVTSGTPNLYTMLNQLDERLIDELDKAINAPTPEGRQDYLKSAGGIVKDYVRFVNTDPLVQVIDRNPFSRVNVRGRLVATLDELAKQLP
jgi:hypothetical protein